VDVKNRLASFLRRDDDLFELSSRSGGAGRTAVWAMAGMLTVTRPVVSAVAHRYLIMITAVIDEQQRPLL